MTHFNLTKAVDTVSRDELRKIMAKVGCPSKFIPCSMTDTYGAIIP